MMVEMEAMASRPFRPILLELQYQIPSSDDASVQQVLQDSNCTNNNHTNLNSHTVTNSNINNSQTIVNTNTTNTHPITNSYSATNGTLASPALSFSLVTDLGDHVSTLKRRKKVSVILF